MESKIEDEKQNKHSYEKKRWKEAGSYTLLKEMKRIWGRCDDFPWILWSRLVKLL